MNEISSENIQSTLVSEVSTELDLSISETDLPIIELNSDRTTEDIISDYLNGQLNIDYSTVQNIVDSLTEQSVICYYTYEYASSVILSYDVYDGDIMLIKKHIFFDSFSDLKDFVNNIYDESCSDYLLYNKLYLSDAHHDFLFDISKMSVIVFDIFQFGYYNEILSSDDDQIIFNCYYSIMGDNIDEFEIVCVECHAKRCGEGKWKLSDIIW